MDKDKELIEKLKLLKDIGRSKSATRFFKTQKGEYGDGDLFWGIKVSKQRALSKKYWDISLDNLLKLLNSKVHEVRSTATLILVEKYQSSESKKDRKEIFDFYYKNLEKFNNWDLVDSSAYKILGHYLFNYKFSSASNFLKSLAKSSSIWRRRVAVVSTWYFIKNGSYKEIFMLSDILKDDKEDLINKAVGWMLREVGKKISQDRLTDYLDKNWKNLPRVSLRYAIERLPEDLRLYYLNKK